MFSATTQSFVVVVQLLSCVWLFATLWTAVYQASLSFTISQSSLRLMSPESVMPSNHLILCHPLLLLPSIFPSIRVFSNELNLCIRWSKYWSFTFSISFRYSGLIPLGLTGLIYLRDFQESSPAPQFSRLALLNSVSCLVCCFLLNSSTWSLSWSSY